MSDGCGQFGGTEMAMDDLTITKLCAEAMGFLNPKEGCERTIDGKPFPDDPIVIFIGGLIKYDPLHNDEQAMALVKKFDLSITSCGWPHKGPDEGYYQVRSVGDDIVLRNKDLNRAICECVAKMQEER